MLGSQKSEGAQESKLKTVTCLTNLTKKSLYNDGLYLCVQFQQHHQSIIHKIEYGLLRKLLRKLIGKRQSFLDDNFLIINQRYVIKG